MQLSSKNYHSPEANLHYMSNSQYKSFLECEAETMASLRGEWVEEPSSALLVGQYLHSWSDGTRRDFMANHPEMLKKDLTLKADYLQADAMVACLEKDPFTMYMLEGRKEVIFTAEMFGAPWKTKADVHNPERQRIVDLKSTRGIQETVWNVEKGGRVSFVEQYGYLTQAAIYCEVERLANGRQPEDWMEFYLVAVSKQDIPDHEIIDLRDAERYARELWEIEQRMPRILEVKAGRVEPFRCGECAYCRATKRLTEVVHYSRLGVA